MRNTRIGIGLATWLALIGIGLLWTSSPKFPLRGRGAQLARDLWHFTSARRRTVSLDLNDSVWMAVGDPIFVVRGPHSITQVGEIQRVRAASAASDAGRAATTRTGTALLYPNAPVLGPDYELVGYVTPRSLDWVLKTMLPPAKRTAITREITQAYQDYHGEILDALKPVAIAGLRESLHVAEQELRRTLAAHRAELEKLGDQYQQEVIEQELLPLVRTEIWPTVKQYAEPLANQVGLEIWARASLWRFGWRYLYDKSPLPEKNLTQTEWDRFVQDDVIPVLQQHSEDFITAQRQILIDVVHNPKIRATLRDNLTRVAHDDQFKDLVWKIMREAIVDNSRVHATLQQQWKSPEAQQAVRLTSAHIETSVRRIGDLLFGTREDGIAPEFAQVLRNQILDKDCRWFVLQRVTRGRPATAPRTGRLVLSVRHGRSPDVNPFAVTLHGMRP